MIGVEAVIPILWFSLLHCPLHLCPPDPREPRPAAAPERVGDYLRVRGKARAWVDGLKVDAAELLEHGVKGKKKLAEVLDIYLGFHAHSRDPGEREAIMERVRSLCAQTRSPRYHNLADPASCPDQELVQNSMSYLRVLWLMDRLGLETGHYRSEVEKAKPRLDAHLPGRGPWQQAMFREYYDRLGLAWPQGLAAAPLEAGVISRRVPEARLTRNAVYDLTHEVFVAFDYGLKRSQDRFTAGDLEYARRVLPHLALRLIAERDPDLLGEVLSCMTYLGFHEDPSYRKAIDYLLDSQNPNGTWGNYEAHRKEFGPYLEHHVYLHTTMVALGALMEVYEGDWQPEK